jgi:type II secretory pathway pseudopilin PulG
MLPVCGAARALAPCAAFGPIGRSARNRSGWGFTLVELLLVFIILAVVLGLSLPNFARSHARYELRQSADSIVYAMRYCRSRAVAYNAEMAVVFGEGGFRLEQALQGADGEFSRREPLSGRMARFVPFPPGVSLQGAPPKFVARPDGYMDRVTFFLLKDEYKMAVSTEDEPGHVVFWEE